MELFDLESLDSYNTAPQIPSAPSAPPLPSGPGGSVLQESGIDIGNPVGFVQPDGTPTVGTPPAISSAPLVSAAAPQGGAPAKGALASLVTLEQWAAGIVGRTSTGTGLSLEDIIFILLGLMLIAGALFTFGKTQSVIQSTVKNVRGALDTKAAAALAA